MLTKIPKSNDGKYPFKHMMLNASISRARRTLSRTPLSRLGWKDAHTKNGLANKLAALREVPHELRNLLEKDMNLFSLSQDNDCLEYEECLYPLRQNQFYPQSAREFQISPQIRSIIAQVHNAKIGHFGVEKTMDKLVATGHHWKYMREHVKYFIKRCCPFCQKMSYLKSAVHTNPFTTAAYSPFERQNWDSIGPITLQDGSKVHILCAICCFTRWTELWLIDDVSAEATKVPMLQHFNRFGEPAQVLTDNGTQFKNEWVTELLMLAGVEHVTVLAYSKEENAIVERNNKEVLRHLRALVYELNLSARKNIEEIHPAVQRICNANSKAPNKTSPTEILFGNAINLERGLLMPKTALSDRSVRLSDWTSNMLAQQDKIMKKAELLQRTKDETHMANANPNRTEFPVGSWVLVEYHSSIIRRGPPNKLNTFLRGPFKVLRHELDHYTFRNHIESTEETVHIDLLHPFLHDANFIDPMDVARHDAISTFTVESILAHNGTRRTPGAMDFKVRWQGYDASKDLWLPWKELLNNPRLPEYLTNNGMKTLIPREHRVGIYR